MADAAAQQFMKLNVTGSIFCVCRVHGVEAPRRIATCTHAVQDAVHAAVREKRGNLHDFESILSEQRVLLMGALDQSTAGRTGDPVPPAPSCLAEQFTEEQNRARWKIPLNRMLRRCDDGHSRRGP